MQQSGAGKIWRLLFDLEVSFDHREGVLAFRTFVNGRQSGVSIVEFQYAGRTELGCFRNEPC